MYSKRELIRSFVVRSFGAGPDSTTSLGLAAVKTVSHQFVATFTCYVLAVLRDAHMGPGPLAFIYFAEDSSVKCILSADDMY